MVVVAKGLELGLRLGLRLGLEEVFVFDSKSGDRDRAVGAVETVLEARACRAAAKAWRWKVGGQSKSLRLGLGQGLRLGLRLGVVRLGLVRLGLVRLGLGCEDLLRQG